MLKKTITYTDFNGSEQTEDLYFHVSKTSILTTSDENFNEIVRLGRKIQEQGKFLEANPDMKLDENDLLNPKNIVLSESVRMIARLLDHLVDLAYGKRTEDGRRFIKSEEVLAEFKQSAAYDALIEHMVTHQDEMLTFVERLMQMK